MFSEFATDRPQVTGGGGLETARTAFAAGFAERAEFQAKYEANATAESFVDAVSTTVRQTSGVDLDSQRDNLIGRYDGADGIKTGYTGASGFNLVSSVTRGTNHVIAVVMGGRTAVRRDLEMVRLLDQTWRLRPQLETPPTAQPKYRSEIVLVARTALVTGSAETLSQDNSSPTRLWLGELPGGKAARPPLAGQLTQETYVRVYIPIKSSEPK